MSRLDELIAEFCPDGVEYKKISEIADTNIGLATSVSSNKSKKGVQLLHNSDIQQNKIAVKKLEYVKESFAEKNRNKVFKYHDLITVHTGDIGTSAVIEEEYVGAIGFTTITTRIHNFDKVSPYYLCHYLNSRKCKDEITKDAISDRNNLNQKSFDQLLIPLPPLPVQQEIVRILDHFTELTAELQKLLAIEEQLLTERQKYYLNKLVSTNIQFETMQLRDLVKVRMCKRIQKNQTVSDGNIPFYKNGTLGKQADAYIPEELFAEYKAKYPYPNKGSVMLSTAGTVGRAYIFDGKPAYFQDSNVVWLENDESSVSNEYLYWFCKSMPWKLPIRGTIKHLHNDMILETPISVPPLNVQNESIRILKTAINEFGEIRNCLLSEIAARQKQYEYYRDKLLSFKELKKS